LQLVWTARGLRDGARLLSGRPVRTPPGWLIGAVENPFAPPREFRARRLAGKVAANTEFVQTQFVFDLAPFERWMTQLRDLGWTGGARCSPGRAGAVAADAGLREHPGARRPRPRAPVPATARGAGGPGGRRGVRICVETVRRMTEIPGVAGVHLMAFGYQHGIPDILAEAGFARRDPVAPTVPSR
jgi:methylenetetrahydrofolate reductase (NADPH)